LASWDADEAIIFDAVSYSWLVCTLQAGADDSVIAAYRDRLDQVVSALGAEFAERYDVSLRERLERDEEAANRRRKYLNDL
jgi:hypothetical protein